MPFSKLGWWYGALAALLFSVLGGCDVPIGESPSVNTRVDINTPLVANKTLSVLGGPKSKYEPLIDTTSSDFDSLFTVGNDPKDISIVQEVDSFDIGSLDAALDSAGGNLAVNQRFENNLIQSSDLLTQKIEASYSRENSEYTSSPANTTASNIFDTDSDDAIVVPFPASILEAPDFGAVDGRGATVESVTLTSDVGSVNEITFTLTNNGNNELDDGNGNAPRIRIEDTLGTVKGSASSDFGQTIPSGGTASTTLDVSGLSLGNNTQYRLIIESNDTDVSNTIELETALSEWRYQAATLSNAGNVSFDISANSITTVGSGASQFEGIDVGSGSITLAINNQFSFDLSVDQIQLQNASEPSFGDISDLAIDTSFARPPVATGTEATETIDMAGRGVSEQIDVSVSASPASDTITVSADDRLGVSNTGSIEIQTMYFRPTGETLQTSGTVALDNDRVTFQAGDFAELSNAVVDINNLQVPDVTFDTLALSYPDLRRKDADGDGTFFEVEDSLRVRFVENPSGNFEFDRDRLSGSSNFELSFGNENIQLRPQRTQSGNEVRFSVRGRLESDPNAQAIVDATDKVSARTSIGNFEIQKLKVSGADPFSVAVTPDADNDGTLDLSDDGEVQTASFGGFKGLTSRVNELQLASTSLDFSLETKNLVSTDAQVYAAIQGTNETSSIFLAGKRGTPRGVSSVPFQKQFVEGTAPIQSDSLIKLGLGLENANLGERVQRTKTIDNDNSTVGPFINSLPTEIRFAGQARLNTDAGDLKLRRPVKLNAGFTLDVPLQIKGEFVFRDTIDADLSTLNDLTDSDGGVNVSAITFQFGYENGLPLGADTKLTIADSSGSPIRTLSGDSLRIKPGPKNEEGAAAQGTVTLDLGSTREDLQALADGREIQLRLKMTQKEEGPAAQLRADDTISLNMKLNIKASG